MGLWTPEFFSALISLVIIDLVLAGDNAIVIGLAARNLPREMQKKVIFWGTGGAIVVRSLATLVVVWLLKIPGLLVVGGFLLIWIAYKLLVEEKSHNLAESHNLWSAVKTIIIADAVMGLDNVLAVAGAAHGSFVLVILGLLISVPIVVWGSTLILKWINRYPWIIYAGAGILAWTAAKMIVGEPMLKLFFDSYPMLKWGVTAAIIIGVLILGKKKKSNHHD